MRRQRTTSRPRESTNVVPEFIDSTILGRLRLQVRVDVLDEEWKCYEASRAVRPYGTIEIVLRESRKARTDWHKAVARAESLFPRLLKKEPKLRRAAVPAICRELSSYGYPWSGTERRLMSSMKLRLIVFCVDGTGELWYSGGEPFHRLDVVLTLGPRLGLRNLRFDG